MQIFKMVQLYLKYLIKFSLVVLIGKKQKNYQITSLKNLVILTCVFKFASSKLIIIRDALKFNMVNIGGVDIHNGEKKLILATMWLIIRKHTLNVIYLNKR